jgi:hypothetical protein
MLTIEYYLKGGDDMKDLKNSKFYIVNVSYVWGKNQNTPVRRTVIRIWDGEYGGRKEAQKVLDSYYPRQIINEVQGLDPATNKVGRLQEVIGTIVLSGKIIKDIQG